MLVFLIYLAVYAVAIALSVAILAGSLFLVEDVKSGSFQEFGVGATLARCAAIVIVTTLLGFIPYGVILVLIVWFAGIMFLFQKSFGQTFVVFLVNVIFSLGVWGALGYVLERMLPAG